MIIYPVASDGIQTRVFDAGNGPAVVFVHGFGARADRWRHNLQPVADAGYRSIAIDLPGHGYSTKTGSFDFSVPNVAAWLLRILDQIGVREMTLVGTSLGGFISGEVACRVPDRVKALMLVGTIGMIPLGPEGRATIGARFTNVSREGTERKMRTVLFDHSLVTPAAIEEEWRINNSMGAAEAFARIARYITNDIDTDVVGEKLKAMRAKLPLAVVWGAEDKGVPLEVGHKVRDLLAPDVYEEIPAAGHGPYQERPAAFNKILLDFLRRTGAPS